MRMTRTIGIGVAGICLLSPIVRAETFSGKTDWMAGKIGVFQHHLFKAAPASFAEMEKTNPKAMAEQLSRLGVDYFCLTLNQCDASFLCPNDTFEDLCGYRRGERCFQRDVPMELADALAAKGIRLLLYTTGTPPRGEKRIVDGIGYAYVGENKDPLYTRQGAENWAKCLREWSLRYGRKVSGWWLDGCYTWLGFDKPEVGAGALFAEALKAGNPDAVVTFNPGIGLKAHSPAEDYLAGEINEPFFKACTGRWAEGRQWHLLTYLGAPLAMPQPLRYTDAAWIDWIRPVLRRGGCVTIDCGNSPTGELPPLKARQIGTIVSAVRGTLSKEESGRIAREARLFARTERLEGANVCIDTREQKFFRSEFAWKHLVPDGKLVRKGPQGEEIWSDAIRDALDRHGRVYLPVRVGKPYWIDRTIVLKSGQAVSMGPDIFPLGAERTYLKPVPGFAGPIVANASPGDRDIYLKRVIVEGADEPFVFTGVEGLVVRETGVFGARGACAVRLRGVRDFRIDGLLLDGCPDLAAAVSADVATDLGMVRNVTTRRGGPAVTVVGGGADVWVDSPNPTEP